MTTNTKISQALLDKLLSFTQIGYDITGTGELVPVDPKAQARFSDSIEKQIERFKDTSPKPGK